MFYWPYLAPMIVICALSLSGSAPMIRTGLAIAANWCLNTGFVLGTGIYDPWYVYLAVDALTAFIILYQPAGKMQSVIGWTFIAQIVLHVIYFFSNQQIAAYPYWQMLTAVAFIQLVLLGGWIGGHWRRRYFSYRRDPFRLEPDGAQGVAP